LNGWELAETKFYTGIHDATANLSWHSFWINKTTQMGQTGIKVVTRPLRYRNKTARLADGTEQTFLAAEEKGIDVRIALDVISGARKRFYDVAIVFSQDQDLAEVAAEIRTSANEQARWIKIASHFLTVQRLTTGEESITRTGSALTERCMTVVLTQGTTDHRQS
jgi:uncharacterized LabA/DUF88 family protein